MQVTHVQDYTTHAIIGGGVSKSFGVSDDPAFFQVLFDTLYTHKKEAVCREVLCNAWDAHIAAGRTELPVLVSLKDGVLTIQDHGHGIPDEDMEARYCVMGGGSTKKNDGQQTGGFGLGCKAPFCYTEHFEVVSCHAGTKTIYRLSKNSPENGGRPGLIPIVSMPTDEHGLTVKINIKPGDERRFLEVLRRIARVGEMNVTLSGQKVETLPFSEAKHGFLITEEFVTGQETHHRIYVRYGNVCYPVENHDRYRKIYDGLVKGVLERIGNGKDLILQAEPNTISVTPSREALSMSDMTVETLSTLLTQFDELCQKQLEIQATKAAHERVEWAWSEFKPAALLTSASTLFSGNFYRPQLGSGPIIDFDQIGHRYVSYQYPSFKDFWRRDLENRLRSMIEGGFGGQRNRGKIQSFLTEVQNGTLDSHTTWFHRRLISPLVKAMEGSKELSNSRLMVYANFHQPGKHDSRGRYRYPSNGPVFTEVGKFSRLSLQDYLPFLRNFVLLTYNRMAVQERLRNHPAMVNYLGRDRDCLIYLVQRNEAKAEAARAFFRSQGIYVVDLTKRYYGEHVEATAPVNNVREYKPKKKGLPIVSSVLKPNAKFLSTDLAKAEDVKRIEKPEFVIKSAAVNDKQWFDDYADYRVSKSIVSLYGDKGGIIINENQMTKYLAMGALEFTDWVAPQLMDEMLTNPRIQQYYTVRAHNTVGLLGTEEAFLIMILKDPVLQIYFNVASEATEEDKNYIRIWQFIEKRQNSIHEFAKKHLHTIKPSDDLRKLRSKLTSNPRLHILDQMHVNRILKQTNPNKDVLQQQTDARDLIIWALRG